ncbi:MAG: acetylesterase [Phycisphaera sp.]|nr:acetylesterase [Phycisphaera sp.]
MFKQPLRLSCVLLIACVIPATAAKNDDQPPDFTKGDKMTGKVIWAFGPTGAYGSIWSNRYDTAGVTQMYVTKVDPDSPASGKLQKDDVILGSGSPFRHDVRKEFAAAITEAEKLENNGKLELTVWRKGKTSRVTLQLRPMGTYSETSPVECEKTERIIEAACAYIEKHGLTNGIAGQIDALGLLATGDKKYLPMVREYARGMGDPNLKLDLSPGKKAWTWGYANLFLAEYYLATGDEYVLPAIKEYTTKIAMGQSRVGTWGHGMAIPDSTDGEFRHGILDGYGALNQAGLGCAISLVLGRKCGVKAPVVDQAIDRAAAFFRYYVDKGSVPYGDHGPWMHHASNGKSSATAVFFDLLGDAEAAAFFSRMTLASYNDRERGHTGNFWSFLWGGLGAAVAGDEAESAYLKELRWFYELERRSTGDFVYQGQLASDPNKYRNWSCTGARLLHYCAPRRKLQITGNAGRAAKPLGGSELQAVVEAGRDGSLEGKSTEELLAMLHSWSPVVRRSAAEALGDREEDVTKQLVAMLQSGDRYARYGACEGLRCAGRDSKEAADALVRHGLESDDPTLQYHAMYAFTLNERGGKGMTGVALVALPALLKLACRLDPADPLNLPLANVLFYSGRVDPVRSVCGRGNNLDKVDRQLLVEATRSLLKATNGSVRSMTSGAVYPHLTPEELKSLWADVYVATTERAPSGVMFADGVRTNGIELMARHHVKEGLEAGANLISEERWGSDGRLQGGVPAMAGYGGAVKEVLPMMKEVIEKRYAKDPKNRAKLLGILEKAAGEQTPDLTSIAPYIKRANGSE